MTKSSYNIESVENALRILLMLREQASVRVADVSAALGVARSTAHRLLSTLVDNGFAQQQRGSHLYQSGPVLLSMGMFGLNYSDVQRACRPNLTSLCRRLQETTQLVVLMGNDTVFIDSVECTQPIRVTGRTGTVLPAHATAAGKALIAYLPDQEIESMVSEGLRSITPSTIVNPEEFYAEVAEIRRRGYALNDGESLDGLRAVATAICDANGKAIAALAVSVPSSRGNLTRLRSFATILRQEANIAAERLRNIERQPPPTRSAAGDTHPSS